MYRNEYVLFVEDRRRRHRHAALIRSVATPQRRRRLSTGAGATPMAGGRTGVARPRLGDLVERWGLWPRRLSRSRRW